MRMRNADQRPCHEMEADKTVGGAAAHALIVTLSLPERRSMISELYHLDAYRGSFFAM